MDDGFDGRAGMKWTNNDDEEDDQTDGHVDSILQISAKYNKHIPTNKDRNARTQLWTPELLRAGCFHLYTSI